MRAYSNTTGRPRYAAFRNKSSDGVDGQRIECVFFPTPDAVYVLSYKFTVQQDRVRTANPYPLGGMIHAETWKCFVLSEAEAHMNDEMGVYTRKKMEMLAASVRFDSSALTPEKLGLNLDRSDRQERRSIVQDINIVTVNGVSP
jgi:hypothetical protein